LPYIKTKGAYLIIGDDYYSYNTCIRTTLGDGVSVGNVTKYSTTTSKHQSGRFANVKDCDFKVDNIDRGVSADDLRAIATSKDLSTLLRHNVSGLHFTIKDAQGK
jgi:hypothetical protein